MIKINFNGFTIEVNTVEEALQFTKKTTESAVVKKAAAPVLRRKSKNAKRVKWEESEVRFVLEALDRGHSTASITKVPSLRQRHPKSSIESLVAMVKNRKFGTASALVRNTIMAHSGVRKIPVQSVA